MLSDKAARLLGLTKTRLIHALGKTWAATTLGPSAEFHYTTHPFDELKHSDLQVH